jgi:hypothetical protein
MSLRGGLLRRRRRQHEEGPLPAASYLIFFGRPYQACRAEGFWHGWPMAIIKKARGILTAGRFSSPAFVGRVWPITRVPNFQLSCTSCLEVAEAINTNAAFCLSCGVRCIHRSPQTDPAPQFPSEAPKNFGTEIHEIKVS